MSIRARLALGSAAAVAVAIVLASAVVYFLVQKELRAQVDRNLKTEATQIGKVPIPFAILVYPPNIFALDTPGAALRRLLPARRHRRQDLPPERVRLPEAAASP